MIRLFVGNIPNRLKEGDVRRVFEERGYKIDDVYIVKDRMTGYSRGFGFVNFETTLSDEELIAQLNAGRGTVVESRKLTINTADPRGTKSANTVAS